MNVQTRGIPQIHLPMSGLQEAQIIGVDVKLVADQNST